jgi:HEAT repeats
MRVSKHAVLAVVVLMGWAATTFAMAPESKRLGRAKDLIADERWPAAIEELRTAVDDPKEPRKDEALYWLAHSLNQSGDSAAGIETITRLERDYPTSMWVKPARALRIEIAVRLNRSDVLWWMAMPPAPMRVNGPRKESPKGSHNAPAKVAPKEFKEAPPSSPFWVSDTFSSDVDLRIQALGALMKTDADRAIPLLQEIAFETPNPNQAGRAVFMLAQSSLPKAKETVVQVAKTGPESVQIVAVRVLGRLGGPEVSGELMAVYGVAKEPVKFEIVKALGDRSEKVALQRIVETEKDVKLRNKAIEGLGQAGAVQQLVMMYKTAPLLGRRSIINGLFIARADGELIRIAGLERNLELNQEACERLRLLGTPKAKEYLLKVSEKR